LNNLIYSASQFSAVPFHVSEEIQATAMVYRGAPWQPPPLTALRGIIPASNDPVLLVVNEMPLAIYSWFEQASKSQLEELHLQHFITDYSLAFGERLYTEFSPGNDPPDFQATTSEGERHVDCVQFAIQARREAYGRFDEIRRTLFAANPNNFGHLHGLLVYVWVITDEGGLRLPLNSKHKSDLIEQLSRFRFSPGTGVVTSTGMPSVAPDNLNINTTLSGWYFCATPFLVSAPVSSFFNKMGFELSFVYTTQHTASEVWSELSRRINQHDKPEINDLVITIGGPDRNGYVHPSEEAIFDFMLLNPHPISQPEHLQRILAHGWETGRIVQFYPEMKILHQGRFPSVVPAHRPLIGQ
jgi:hypothetical protein